MLSSEHFGSVGGVTDVCLRITNFCFLSQFHHRNYLVKYAIVWHHGCCKIVAARKYNKRAMSISGCVFPAAMTHILHLQYRNIDSERRLENGSKGAYVRALALVFGMFEDTRPLVFAQLECWAVNQSFGWHFHLHLSYGEP